jgi:hypothetical protein
MSGAALLPDIAITVEAMASRARIMLDARYTKALRDETWVLPLGIPHAQAERT